MAAAGTHARRLDGPAAESLACRHLHARGLRLVERNYHCRGGEIDLVMRHDDVLVFVEVRYRSSNRFGRPEETVGPAKRRRLLHAAQHYLQRHAPAVAARFDVVAITPDRTGYAVQWIRDAFGASDA